MKHTKDMVSATVSSTATLSLLAQGILSRDLSEALRTVDCEQGQAFLINILDRLYDAAKEWKDPLLKKTFPDIDLPEIHLLDAQTYALHLKEKGVCHIGVDKQLIKSLDCVDVIAFAIAHELGHEVFRKLYRVNDDANASVAEEIFCDRFGLQIMTDAGYSPLGAANFFDYVIREQQGDRIPEWLKSIVVITDEHLSPEVRWAQVKEDFPGIARLSTGSGAVDDGRPLTPVPTNIATVIENATWISPFEDFLKQRNFNSASQEDKLKVLIELLPQLDNNARQAEFLNLLSKTLTWSDSATLASPSLQHLTDVLIQSSLRDEARWAPTLSGFFQAVRHGFQTSGSGVPPLGVLRNINTLMQQTFLSPDAPAPTEEELHEVLPILKLINDLGITRGTEPIDVEWSVSREEAFTACVGDITGRKAEFLFHTIYRGHLDATFVDNLDLDVLDTCIARLPTARGLSTLIERRRVWERGIDDYEAFRSDPAAFISQFSEVFSPPVNAAATEHLPSSHPYRKLRSQGFSSYFADEAMAPHNECAGRILNHLERLIEEDPRRGNTVMRALFLKNISYQLKSKAEDDLARSMAMVTLGRSNYPWDGVLVQFVLKHRESFTKSELIHALIDIGVQADQSQWEALFGGPIARDSKELLSLAHDTASPLTRGLSGREGVRSQTLALAIEAVLRAEPQSPRLSERITTVLENGFSDPSALASSEYLNFRNALREKIWTSQTVPPDRYYQDLSTKTLLRLVSMGERASLFPSQQEKDLACKELQQRLHAMSPKRGKALAVHILQIPPLDVELRGAATSCVAHSYRQGMGSDNGSPRYQKRLIAAMRDDLKYILPDLKHEVSRKTADAVVSQRDLSYALRDLSTADNKNAALLSPVIKGAEAFFTYAGKDKERTENLLNFLLGPLSNESIEDFKKVTQGWSMPRVYRPGDKSSDYVAKEQDDQEASTRKTIALYALHRHFSLLPLEAKAFILKQILIAPERLYADTDETYKHATDYTLNRLFPLDPSLDEQSQNSQQLIRLLLQSYVEEAHESERGFLLTAMLSSTQSGAGTQERPGVRLRKMLEHLGPAYIKLGQALYAYPGTPEDIRRDLASLTGRALEPARWELFEMADERIPEEVRSDIVYVGAVKGAASFNIVAEYRDQRKKPGAIAFLRPFALARAEKGFDDIERVVRSLVAKKPDWKPFEEDALNIIRHAREMTHTETNMSLGALQHERAIERYDGRLYFSHGTVFNVTTAHWRTYGDGFRTMDQAPGSSFQDLPEETARQRKYKQAIAKVIFAIELESILSGESFDFDRHGRQYHVCGNTITALDHGGESLSKTTAEDREKLASVVERMVSSIQSNDERGPNLSSALLALKGHDDYSQRLRKALLSMSSVYSYLSPKDVEGVLAVCFLQGALCKEVEDVLSNLEGGNKVQKIRNLPSLLKASYLIGQGRFSRMKGPKHPTL